MKMVNILNKIRPNSQWVLKGSEYKDLEWLDKKQSKPTEQEILDGQLLVEQDDVLSELKEKGEIYTLNGVDYQVPFMKDDADGLIQVNAAFQLGVTETAIHFTNGTKMPIKLAEFNDFAVWFVTKRNSFFI